MNISSDSFTPKGIFIDLKRNDIDFKKFLCCRKDRPKVADIDLTLCTHFILIGSCKLDDNCQVILPSAEIFDEINKLKKSQNADPEVLFSLTPNNKCMSKVVLSSNMTNQLITKVTEFIEDNSVDGFDIDWEFPVWSSDAKPTDKKGFIDFLKALKEEFDKSERKILITVAVAAAYTIVEKAYDVDGLNNYVDYVQIMNYDFHMYSKWQPFTAFNAPLFKKNVEIGIVGRLNSDYSTRFWLSHGLLANKTVFGLPTYGRGFTLMNQLLHFVYAPASGPSEYGDSYEFTTICNLTESSDYKYVYDTESRCPYLYGG
ncbi:unnamed protein product, partial [Anisakis simplex]|uniref:Glyco_18 domain-containing protein n=1 Tax=Anisakis simplex TaxID=6269 RepID=A0A0M3KDN2_ANISI